MKLSKYLITQKLDNNHDIVINCLSGAVDVIEHDIFENLKQSRFDLISNNQLNELIERGYLLSKEEESEIIQTLRSKYEVKQINNFVDFVIIPSYDCNLNCPYCFQKNLNEENMFLSEKQIDEIFEAIGKLSRNRKGKKCVQLFGGEPLLPKNKKLVEKTLWYSEKTSLPMAIVTNGTNIASYKHIIEKYNQTIHLFQITIDGSKEMHDKRRITKNKKPTFDLIINSIDFLLDNGVATHVRVNIDKQNIDSLPKLASFFEEKRYFYNRNFKCVAAPVEDHCSREKGVNIVDESYLLEKLKDLSRYPFMDKISLDRIPKIVKHLERVLKQEYSSPMFDYCQANRDGYYVFAPDGLLYPCTEAAGHKELAIGEFLPQLKIYDEKYKQWSQRSILTLKKCKDCSIATLCGGGCAFAAYSINGDVSKPYCHDAHNIIRKHLEQKRDQIIACIKENNLESLIEV